MAVKRASILVDLGTPATVAAANVTLAAAVAALPSGFFPDDIAGSVLVDTTPPLDRKSIVHLICGATPYQDWIATTQAAVILVSMSGRASVAAAQTAIDAVITTQEVAGNQLRKTKAISLAIGGQQEDVVAMLFTDGAPATS